MPAIISYIFAIMLTRYILTVAGAGHELTSEHIHNWDQIVCAYSRKDYNGVVRSFTSKFEFVGEAYDLLFDEYLHHGVKANAGITILTITDAWEWEEQFSAPLDFSTIQWDGLILSISAIDNSLAALINSKKTTRYEFIVGTDIMRDGVLNYDRLIMLNSAAHELMSNTTPTRPTEKTSSDIFLDRSLNFRRAMTYTIGDGETYESSPVSFQDETDSNGSYFLKVEKLATIEIEADIEFDRYIQQDGLIINDVDIRIKKFTNVNSNVNDCDDVGSVFSFGSSQTMQYVGCYPSLEALKAAYPLTPQNSYAIIGSSNSPSDVEAVYFTPSTNIPERLEWLPGNGTVVSSGHRGSQIMKCGSYRYIYKYTLQDLPAGTMIAMFYKANIGRADPPIYIRLKSASIKTKWRSRAKAIYIDSIRPLTVAKALLDRICEGKLNTSVHISEYDGRLKDTYLLAAECVRAIPQAKFYSSFSEFCDWMQTVFGYTYCLGERIKSSVEGMPDEQDIFFCHRSELFAGDNTKTISNCRDISYTVDSAYLYSSVEVGYDKQDYEAECGRDEWNFTAYYTTGIDASEKKLSLKSKYRADCYGLEFTAQKRTKETKDDKSDSTVFFVLCDEKEIINEQTESRGEEDGESTVSTELVLHRGTVIDGALSDTVFNGEFSPRHCVKANEGFISSMCQPLVLKFASTEGSADISIDGIPVNGDIAMTSPLFTMGRISFSSDDVSFPEDVNSIIEVYSHGVIYKGFISSVELKYAKSEAAKYKLIVKQIEI